jgi:glycosyltransferase involved in cell wall biosynthesis
MKILYIAPFQHPALGGSTRCYHFIRELAQRHSITLLALGQIEIPAQVLTDVASHAEKVLTVSVYGLPRSAGDRFLSRLPLVGSRIKGTLRRRRAVRQMRDMFRALLQREAYDVVVVHARDVFAVIEDWNESPLVADVCDATCWRLWQGLRYAPVLNVPWRTLRYLEVRRIDRKILRQTPHQIFISRRDRDAMRGFSPRSRVVPNGIDLAYWTRKTDGPDMNTIVFTGVMSYQPNADGVLYLLRKILPRVQRFIPDLRVLLVGRDPTTALREAARRCPNVRITGYVDDVRPYLEEATVFVAPLRYASGMQNKALEALAMKVPVVTTPSVAAGLEVDGASELPLLVADGEEKFAEHILYLLRNEAARHQLAHQGRQFVETHFDWSRSAGMLEEICLEAAGLQPARQQTAGEARPAGSRSTAKDSWISKHGTESSVADG